MMKKTYLMAAIAALALVGTILLVTAGGDDAKQQTADTSARKTDSKTASAEPVPAITAEAKNKKPATNAATQKKVATTTADDSQVRVRRGPPSKRFYTTKAVDEPKIAPATEYRGWTTQQWASKVNTLRQQGKTDLAQQYIAAYEKTYPNKSLAPYLN